MVLNAYFETGFPLPTKLSEEFTKQFPNVTFDIKEDQFANLMENSPRVLSEDNAPDLIRLPSMSDLVANGLLKNLDGYFTEFGGTSSPLASSSSSASKRAAVRAAPARSMPWASTTP